MTVVSNTSPLCYLVLIGSAEVLPRLYGSILTTQTVLSELRHPDAPESVRRWATAPPDWLKVHPDPPETDPALDSLHAGERTALGFAEQIHADVLLLDDAAARALAMQRNLKVSGLLGVLRDAAESGLVDLPTAVDRLRHTNFRASPELLSSLLPRTPG
jgi:predicted nucleic acid-binding protein